MSLREKLKQLKEDNFNFLTDLYNQAGDICQLKVGRQRIVFINHPDYAKHILQTNLSNYPKDNFYSLAEQIIGKNILTTNEQVYWSEHRKIIAGLFQPQSVKGMGADIIDVVNEYSKSIQTGQKICLNQLTTTLALKIITRLLFSKTISEENIVLLAELLSYFGTLLIKKRQPLSLTVPIYCNTTFWKNHSKLKKLIKSLIKATHDSTKPDLISLLTEYQCPHSGKNLNEEELFSEAALMLFAGHETTANALNWLFITLSKHPELRSSLQEEIHSVLNGKSLEVNDLENMPLVRGLVMEVLRLFPSFPAVPRYCLQDDVVGDYLIPAKAMVVVNIAMIHRHPKFWSNPEGFDLHRFINQKPQHKYAFLPFINGPRVCIGNNLALLELQIVTAQLLQKFNFNLTPGQDVNSNYVISLRTKKDVFMHVV